MRGFNTLRFQVTPDGNAGLTPSGLEGDYVEPEAPAEEAAPDETNYDDQFAQLQQTIAEQQEMLQRLAPIAEQMQGPSAAPQQEGYLRPPDPFSENYPDELAQYVNAAVDQRTAHLQQFTEQQNQTELRELARDRVADFVSQNGELIEPAYEEGFDGEKPIDRIIDGSVSIYPEMAQRYGDGMRAEEEAIRAAYENEKRYQDALVAAADARQQNQINALRQAPSEPGSSGIAAQPAVTTQLGGWDAFKSRHGL